MFGAVRCNVPRQATLVAQVLLCAALFGKMPRLPTLKTLLLFGCPPHFTTMLPARGLEKGFQLIVRHALKADKVLVYEETLPWSASRLSWGPSSSETAFPEPAAALLVSWCKLAGCCSVLAVGLPRRPPNSSDLTARLAALGQGVRCPRGPPFPPRPTTLCLLTNMNYCHRHQRRTRLRPVLACPGRGRAVCPWRVLESGNPPKYACRSHRPPSARCP